jgi:hypothetical protein
MQTQRNLDDLFASAARETGPVSKTDVESIITTAGPTSGTTSMITALLTGAAAAAAGIIGYVSMTSPNVAVTTQPATSRVQDAAPARPSEQSVQAVPNVTTASETSDTTKSTINGAGISVIALDASNIAALDLDPMLVENVQRIIASVDSLRYCDAGRAPTICAWNNGRIDRIDVHAGNGPLPVMFTTHDGKGQMVLPEDKRTIDVNALIPVETQSENGSMLMWFPPTQTLLQKLPEDIAKTVSITIDAGRVDGRRVTMNMIRNDGPATMMSLDMDSLITSHSDLDLASLKTMLPNLDSLVTSAMKHVTIDVANEDADGNPKEINIAIADRNVHINLDSVIRVLNGQDSGTKVRALIFSDSVRFNRHDGVTPPSVTAQVMVDARMFVIKTPTVLGKMTTKQPTALQELRSQQGALKVQTVYPNPATDGGATLSYSLSEDRLLNVDLHDLTGTRLARLVSNARKRAGQGQVAFIFKDVAPGMYLLYVTTDKGETAVQRLVVQR